MTHHIKLQEQFADAVLIGRKNFEIRYNDRGYQTGDEVVFDVIDNVAKTAIDHPLNKKTYRITYILSGWGLKENFVAFGIMPVNGV